MVVTSSQVTQAHDKAYKRAKSNNEQLFVCFKVQKNEHDPTQIIVSFETGEWEDMYEILDELREPESKYNADFFFKVYPGLTAEESFKKVELQMAICKGRMKKMVNIDKPSHQTTNFLKTMEMSAS